MEGNELLLEFAPSGHNGCGTLTAKLGSEVLAVKPVDMTKPKVRLAFIDAVCNDRPGIDRQVVESELLRLADGLAAMPEPPPYVPFPADVLPKVMADFIHEGAAALGCDESYIALPLLGACACCCGQYPANSPQARLVRAVHPLDDHRGGFRHPEVAGLGPGTCANPQGTECGVPGVQRSDGAIPD